MCKTLRDHQGVGVDGGHVQGVRETGGYHVVRTFKVMVYAEEKGKIKVSDWRLTHLTSPAEQKPRVAVLHLVRWLHWILFIAHFSKMQT